MSSHTFMLLLTSPCATIVPLLAAHHKQIHKGTTPSDLLYTSHINALTVNFLAMKQYCCSLMITLLLSLASALRPCSYCSFALKSWYQYSRLSFLRHPLTFHNHVKESSKSGHSALYLYQLPLHFHSCPHFLLPKPMHFGYIMRFCVI